MTSIFIIFSSLCNQELNSPEAVESWGASDFPAVDDIPRSASMYNWTETTKDKDDLSIGSSKGQVTLFLCYTVVKK